MKSTKEFPFEKSRRITSDEVKRYRKAIEKKTGRKIAVRPGRPPKSALDKYVPISLRLHPKALKWLKIEAKRQAMPYQTILNNLLLKQVA